MRATQKHPVVALIPAFACLALFVWVILPWANAIDLKDSRFAFLCGLSGTIWLMVLWWSAHHLTYQIVTLFRHNNSQASAVVERTPSFVILYPTLDDFQESSCESCVEQEYPNFRTIICDDSRTRQMQDTIDAFAQRFPGVSVLRRQNNIGFKAGNLNHAVRHTTRATDEWLVIVDADEILPPHYLDELARFIQTHADSAAFIQCAHHSDAELRSRPPIGTSTRTSTEPTEFQKVLGLEIDVFYDYDLSSREAFGFVPMLGHGVAVRRAAWDAVAGFPEVVSEDYAFSLRLARKGLTGTYADHIVSWESFPKDFGSFVTRISKFAGGSAELFCSEIPAFLRSNVSLAQKVDLVMQLAWYPLMPLILLNEVLSAYVCSKLWSWRLSVLHPLMPYLFLLMFAAGAAVLVSRSSQILQSVRYWFWAQAVYGSSLPIAAFDFVRHLLARPTFRRTPKGLEAQPRYPNQLFALLSIGVAELILAVHWWSPFSPVLAARAVAYLSFSFYLFLARRDLLGKLSRIIVWAPGLLLILALHTMWKWGKYLGVPP